MTTEDKEKTEVLNAFFTSVFKSQTSYPQGTPLSDLTVSAGEQTKLPMIQEEIVRDLLLQLDCPKSVGPDEIHPRVLRDRGRGDSRAAFHHLSALLVDG